MRFYVTSNMIIVADSMADAARKADPTWDKCVTTQGMTIQLAPAMLTEQGQAETEQDAS